MTRVAVFGWGLVAPGAANIAEFESALHNGGTQLEPFNGFGPDTFLVGRPKFDFKAYTGWLAERFPPSRAKQLTDKLDETSLFAIGAFIQALGQNPGIEKALQDLGTEAHVYVGNALSAYPTVYGSAIELYRAQRRWNRFWSHPERNAALAAHLAQGGEVQVPNPSTVGDPDLREEAEDAWFAYWASRSEALQKYLTELAEIESPIVEGDVAAGKMKMIRDKRRRLAQLEEKWGSPPTPWDRVSPNVLWNIQNMPAAQISMLGKITGLSFAPVAACSTFSVALKLAIDAIERGEAKLVVMGCADPPPHPLCVGAFYGARVLAADGSISKPLTGLKGTHVAGGSCVWIIGDLEYGKQLGFRPLGVEPLAVGVSSDADHIITPSEEGPRTAMRQAIAKAAVSPDDVVTWDLHATATPGDYQELQNLQSVVPKTAVVTARKGSFGHGMGVGGGWELTAQYLGLAAGTVFSTGLESNEVNPAIGALGQSVVMRESVSLAEGGSAVAGKLSMGVGGVNACVVSRAFKKP